MDGILNINKPWGETSFKIVAMVRRLTGEKRVGHAGTLDPAATGVLPVCLGKGTRVTEFLMETTKAYRAQIEMGVVTDTYDAEGRVIRREDSSGVYREHVESALASFCGSIWQTPPMYSAVKYHGKPLYQLARVGITVERKSRLATIHNLTLVDWQWPVATIEVVCGKGTYIRSLAYDMGQLLGCGAYLKNLVRLRYGPFNIESAISVSELEDACRRGYWQQYVYPLDSGLLQWNAIVVNDDMAQNIRNGRPLVLDEGGRDENGDCLEQRISNASGRRCRAYALDGCFLGVLRFEFEKGWWHPEKVFS